MRASVAEGHELGRWRWVLWLAVAVHALGLLASLRYLPESADFAVYYAAARSILRGVSPYSQAAQQAAALADAQLARALTASAGIAYTPPPFLAWLLVPLGVFPFPLARAAWWLGQLACLWAVARLLVRLLHLPWPTAALALAAFSPLTLTVAVGNVAAFLPWGALLLGASLVRGASLAGAALVALLGVTKVFPAFLLWVPWLCERRRWVARVVALAALMVVVPTVVDASSFTAFMAALRAHQAAAYETMLGQHNLSALLRHLGGVSFRYAQGGDTISRSWPALLPLSREAFEIIQYALWGLGATLAAVAAWRLIRAGRPRLALWSMLVLLLLTQPYTLYIYYAALLPTMVDLVQRGGRGTQTLAIAAYLLLGIGRFAGLTSALLPYPLSLLAYHTPVLALCLLGVAIAIAIGKRQPM